MATAPAPDSDAYLERDDELITGEAVALDLRPGGFVLRAASAAIDWLVYFVGGLLLLTFGVLPPVTATLGSDPAASAAVVLGLGVLLLVGVPIAVETLTRGRSLGRLALGLRIVRDDGGSIGLRHAFIRGLTGVLEIYFTFGGLAAIVALLNGRTKRLGDLIAGTYAQYERVPRLDPPVYGVPAELREWATTADVARMPDPLSRRITQFLRQASQQTPDTRLRTSRSLATEASVYVSPIPQNVSAELFLATIASIRREREFMALSLQRDALARLDAPLRGLPHGFPERSERA